MSRTTYVYVAGLGVVPKSKDPRRHLHGVISDHLDDMLSHADGKIYTSKAKYRAELRARGYEEVGNDRKGFDEQVRNRAPMPAFEPILKEQLDRIGFRGD
jgi:hypothetical protein